MKGFKRQRSVMKHDFSQIPSADIPRSVFKRNHGWKGAFDGGYLIPVYVDEALPGDTFNVKMSAVARLATPLTPFMDNLYLDFFFFSVPNRLLWDNWKKFMGEQVDPGDSTDYILPEIAAPGGTGWLVGDIGDYMGIPPGFSNLKTSALPFRAYNFIWNEWFRDQNLQDSVDNLRGDGPDSDTSYSLLRRGKRHDYFTSCLPWPQKATSPVELPLGSSAPVKFNSARGSANRLGVLDISDVSTRLYDNATAYVYPEAANADELLFADLSGATASTINELREAFQTQKMLERDARAGTRYAEIIASHFKVHFPDVRYRPEYLGGGSVPVQITPIANTSEDASNKQGHLAAVGYASADGVGFTKSFVEHCTVIGLASLRADLTYQQGLERMWSRSTRYDFYFPALAHLGEMAVLNKEIYVQNNAADENAFGYQERWAEYRTKPSRICGILRSDAAGSLDLWHLSQDFASLPVLNASFIEDNPPIIRVVSVPSEPELIADLYYDITAARPLPMYSFPGLIDHF